MAVGNDHSPRASAPPIGATSLLTVFAVLALTVFALLTLADVRSDARLADASWTATQAYYAADAQAQELLARLRAGETPDGVAVTAQEAGRHCAYACPVSDGLELQVAVHLGDDGGYQILCWQMSSTQGWEEQGGLHVWDGELP